MEIKQLGNNKVAFVYANGSKRIFTTEGVGKFVWENLGDGCGDQVATRDSETLTYTGEETFVEFMRKNQRRILRSTWK